MSDTDKKNSESHCTHEMKAARANQELLYCNKCGIFQYGMQFSIKPDGFNYYCELDPFEQIEKMIEIANGNNELVDFDNELVSSYKENRHAYINFLKMLVKKFSFKDSIFFLAIKYMDLVIISNPKINHHLIAFSAFLLAAKFNECDPKLPNLKEFKLQLLQNYSTIELKNYELLCLRYLNYDLNRSNSYSFLEVFLKNGLAFKGEISFAQLDMLYSYGVKLLNNFIKDQRYFDFTPLQIACAIVKLSREAFKLDGWPRCYENIYKLKGEDFMNCYFVIRTIYINKPSTSNTKSPKPNTISSIKSTKNKKKGKNLNSSFLLNNGSFNEDIILSQNKPNLQIHKHVPRPQQDNFYSNIPSISTFTPNYLNNNIKFQANDYYGNSNVNLYSNHYNKSNLKHNKKPQYMNSSDNNDLNSTVDEIVESKHLPSLPNNRSARIQTCKIENYETNCILSRNNPTISPFNLYYFSSQNRNLLNNQNFPVNSMSNYNNQFTMNDYSIKSNNSSNKNYNDNFSINKIYSESERQILPININSWN